LIKKMGRLLLLGFLLTVLGYVNGSNGVEMKLSFPLAVWSDAEDFLTQSVLPQRGRWQIPAGVSFPHIG
jgi:hypothetical protein